MKLQQKIHNNTLRDYRVYKLKVKWNVYLVAERIERDRDREGGERERGEMDLDGDRLRADLLRDRLHKRWEP
jgi:hypothetical protein